MKMESESEHIVVEKKRMNNLVWDNSQLLGILVALVSVLITLVIFIYYRRKKTSRNNILLLGLCDSGKTVIFARLVYGKFVKSHTSVKENANNYFIGSALLKVVDIPGHERLRYHIFDEYKALSRGLVFVIDSLTIQKDIQDVAEFLYNILADKVISSNSPSMLILCNKQDETMAKGEGIIRTLLEKEINILRKTKTSQLESVENTSNNKFLGKEGKDFEFSDLLPMKIKFGASSAVSKSAECGFELDHLLHWLEEIV